MDRTGKNPDRQTGGTRSKAYTEPMPNVADRATPGARYKLDADAD
jgi:hypothetical protein